MADISLDLSLAKLIERSVHNKNILADNKKVSLDTVITRDRCSFDLKDISRAPHFRGCVECIDQSGVSGWCLDARDLSQSNIVKFLFLGFVIGETNAMHSRMDVQDVLGHSCMPGFRFNLKNSAISSSDLEAIWSLVGDDLDSPAMLEVVTDNGNFLLPRIAEGIYTLTNRMLLRVLCQFTAKAGNTFSFGLDLNIASADDVVQSYRLFLGREPETAISVQEKLGKTPSQIVAEFIQSIEFKKFVISEAPCSDAYNSTLCSVIPFELTSWASVFFACAFGNNNMTRGEVLSAVLQNKQVTKNIEISQPFWSLDTLARALACYKVSGPETSNLRFIAASVRAVELASVLVLGRFPLGEKDTIRLVGLTAFDAAVYMAATEEFAETVAFPILKGAFDHKAFLTEASPDLIIYASSWLAVPLLSENPTSLELLGQFLAKPETQAALCTIGVAWEPKALATAMLREASTWRNRIMSGQEATARAFALLGDSQKEVLRALFSPAWYERATGRQFASIEAAWSHYVEEGIAAGFEPSPLVDSKKLSVYQSDSGLPSLIQWLQSPTWDSNPPTVVFDEVFYVRTYPDVNGSGVAPFHHYACYGQFEQKKPNAVFDPDWYTSIAVQHHNEKPTSSYQHFLTFGLADGAAPCKALLSCFSLFETAEPVTLDAYLELCRATRPLSSILSSWQINILLAMFEPSSHRTSDKAIDRTNLDLLIDYLKEGFWKDLPPGPMFDRAFYSQSLEMLGYKISAENHGVLHFLSFGLGAHVTPTKLISAEGYLSDNADLKAVTVPLFEHFVNHGLYEGRRIHSPEIPGVVVSLPHLANQRPEDLNRIKFWGARGYGNSQMASMLAGVKFSQASISKALSNPEMQEMLQRIVELEPAVGPLKNLGSVLAPPFHDAREFVRRLIRLKLERDHFDTIICMPWLRSGGADLVACMLAKAIAIAFPEERILLLRTDQSHFERSDWIPNNVITADISPELSSIGESNAEFILYGLLLRLGAKRIVNVNSRRCWMTFKRFGNRMRDLTHISSYLFCWDQTRDGTRVGYPSEFFGETAGILHYTFTDSDYLRSELERIYRPPANVMTRVKALYSPAQSKPCAKLIAEVSVETSANRKRPRILWGGRLDWQKRFDIVQAVAGLMPDIDFVCWGKPLLGDAPPLGPSPDNLRMHESFSGFDDLPLGDSDLWLFTSAWEGMPTTLIELAMRGVAVVASSVGAVPELIDSETGWPVDEVGNPEAYVQAIRAALINPDERVMRARRLQARAASRYTEDSYVAQIKSVFAQET